MLAALRGLLIAIPLVMLFGALFMAADAVFSGFVTNLLAIDARELLFHLFWIGAWFWLTAGFLRQVLFCTVGIDGFGAHRRRTSRRCPPTSPPPALTSGERELDTCGRFPASRAFD